MKLRNYGIEFHGVMKSHDYIEQMRLLADATRLRLLLLCATRAESVSALAHALGESEPAMSRHLKALAGSALLHRRRRGHFVEYSVAPTPEMVRAILAGFPREDAVLREAQRRLAERAVESRGAPPGFGQLPGQGVGPAVGGAKFQQALRHRLRAQLGPQLIPATMLIGDDAVSLLEVATELSDRVFVAAASVAARTALRRVVGRPGAHLHVALQPQLATLLATELPQGRVDCVMLAAQADDSATLRLLAERAAKSLAPAGRLVVVADYDALEAEGSGAAALLLRRMVIAAGYDCLSLQPLQAERHALLAVAAPRSSQTLKLA